VARSFSTRHHELVVSQADVLDDIPRLTRMRDAPIGEPSDIPIYRLSIEASKCVKMVLTGEGSDEVMGGYPRHVFERFASRYQKMVGPLLHQALVGSIVDRLPYSQRRLQILGAAFGVRDEKERMARWVGALVREEQARLCPLPLPPLLDLGIETKKNSALRKILAFDQSSWLPDNLLERGDRMTMAASIEARLPFLDAKLVEFVSRLPDHYRVRGMRTKSILRQAMKNVLPAEILTRPKVGFRVPTNEWFRGEWRHAIMDALAAPNSLTRTFLDRGAMSKLLGEHIEGRRNHEKLIWSLFTLEIFQREFKLSPG
jgi:asparagine synthase (glutamine-hydrolysing)